MLGSATFTIVTSSSAMNAPTRTIETAPQPGRAGAGPGCAGLGGGCAAGDGDAGPGGRGILRCSVTDGGTPAARPGRYVAMGASVLPSPVLVVDMGAFEANVARAAGLCRGTPKESRPPVEAAPR